MRDLGMQRSIAIGLLGLALGGNADAQSRRPSLSMSGTSSTAGVNRTAPLPLSVRRMSEAQIRQEVIRRLERRIEERREAQAKAEAEAQRKAAQKPAPRPPPSRAAYKISEPTRPSRLGGPVSESAKLQEAMERANGSTRIQEEGDYPPERDAAAAIPTRGGTQGYVSPGQVSENSPWAPPASLAGMEGGIMPPEVSGAPTPSLGETTMVRTPQAPVVDTRMPKPAPSAEAAPDFHILARGETLWALARKYKVTVQDFIRRNAVTSVDDLSVGSKIWIPKPDEPAAPPAPVTELKAQSKSAESLAAAAPAKAGSYTVVAGDTLFKIARDNKSTVDEVMAANPHIKATILSPGMILTIPSGRSRSNPAPVVASRPRARVNPPRPVGNEAPVRSAPPKRTNGDAPYLEWPVSGTITANFGWKGSKPHTGIDVSAALGTTVKAAADGKVIYSGQMRGYGNVVILDHLTGFFTVYGHNKTNLVTKGSAARPRTVKRGQAIATVGATGDAESPQLHFEVRKLNQAVDPFRYLAPRTGTHALRPTP